MAFHFRAAIKQFAQSQATAAVSSNELGHARIGGMKYRPDIDGLRAIAVLAVVLFHAKLDVSGGFIGVDVFFVISGFLITSLIDQEVGRDAFSLASFYERRIRRIFPALFLVVFVTAGAAVLVLFPDKLDAFCKSVLATAVFSSNIYFWHGMNGYFTVGAGDIPLLHTWSLAVEEQFYIFFPPLILSLARNRRLLIGALLFGTVCSLAAAVWWVSFAPLTAFFLAPFRAWEFLFGSLLALQLVPELKSRRLAEALAPIGLGMILYSALALTGASGFPGLNAVPPCLGTALVIYAGEHGTVTTKLLSTKPLVFVGLISYSLYLWHWPLLVLTADWHIFPLNGPERVAVVFASLAMAVLSWRYVELPFRRKSQIPRRQLLFAAAASIAALMAIGVFGHRSQGWPGRIPPAAAELAGYAKSQNPRQAECLIVDLTADKIPAADACIYGSSVTPTYALWGDSHADALVEMLGAVAKRHNEALKFFAANGCPPIAGVTLSASEFSYCAKHNDDVMSYLLGHREISTVIIAANYAAYILGEDPQFGPAGYRIDDFKYLITNSQHTIVNRQGRQKLFAAEFTNTVTGLLKAGKEVVLVYPVPETGYPIPETLASMLLRGKVIDTFTRPYGYYRDRQEFVFKTLDAIQSKNIIRVYPDKVLCHGSACIVSFDGKPLYRDSQHLSETGAEFIAPLFENLFQPAYAAHGQEDGANVDALTGAAN